MTNTSESIKDKTYTINNDIKYSVQSVSTNRTEGQIKLHVAPREILEHNNIESIK